ncbi:MAG: gluconate 2-dehydrogenase subunit 3 family protein [Gemmatimonadota bacterium]
MSRGPGRVPPSSVLSPVSREFRALVETFVPEAAALGESEWSEVLALVQVALEDRPRRLHRQLRLLLRVVDRLALLRHGRRFRALDAASRTRFLAGLQDSRWKLLRRGIWSLRTLAFLGYYGRPGIGAELGYGARAEGWEAVK